MIKKLPLILIFLLILVRSALGYEIVVLKGAAIKPYNEAANAFIEKFERIIPARGLKAIEGHRFTEIVLNKNSSVPKIEKDILKLTPDLIVALGQRALRAVHNIHEIPIIYLLAPRPAETLAGHNNITGINLTTPPEMQFEEIKRLLPQVKRVGVIYNSALISEIINKARKSRTDLDFISLEAASAKDISPLLKSFKGKIDLLWMLPDPSVVTPRTLNSYFLFSFKNKVPVLAFSEKYLSSGASFVVTFDMPGLGRQAADIASRILKGEKAGAIKPMAPIQSKTYINHKIIKKLNVRLAGADK